METCDRLWLYFDKILPLVGVVIGPWLGPFVANRIQNRNNKKALKAEFIQSIYLFFNYRKARYGSAIRSNYNAALASLVWSQLRKLDISQVERIEHERQYSVLKDVADNAESRQHHYFDKLIEIEGVILKQLTDIQRFYGGKTYDAIHNLIQPHLDESNSLRTHDFKSMPKAEFDNVKYSEIIKEFDDDLAKRGDELIRDVMNVFN